MNDELVTADLSGADLEQRQLETGVGIVAPFDFVLDPALVDTPSVDRAFFLEPGVGYIRVASFDPKTAQLLKQAIEKLGGAKLKGLVLDLRNNPGGVVQAALESASYFLKPGQRIISAKGRSIVRKSGYRFFRINDATTKA